MSTIDEIVNEWEKDAKIDPTDISSASLQTPRLHAKYLRILSHWKQKQATLKSNLNNIKQTKTRYYRGEMSREELKEYGWEQYQLKAPLRSEMEQVLNADADVNKVKMQLELVETIIYVLESIMKAIASRDFTISNYIKMRKFEKGEMN